MGKDTYFGQLARGIGFQPVVSLNFDRLEAYPTMSCVTMD